MSPIFGFHLHGSSGNSKHLAAPTGEYTAQSSQDALPGSHEALTDSHEALTGSHELVEKCRTVLRLTQSYQGCMGLIQQSIRNPHDLDLKSDLLATLAPNVDTIRIAYELSLEVEASFYDLLHLSSRKEPRKVMAPTMDKLANLLEFAMCFDKIKSSKPEIQNDLSYFRRVTALGAASNQLERFADTSLDALSFFVADHCPMLKVLSRATECARGKDPSAVPLIAQLANSYCASLAAFRSKSPRVVVHYLRVMAGAILLYDLVSRDGAFCSKSDVKIKRCLKELIRWKSRESLGSTPAQLLETVKYWSRHLHDASTPAKIRALLDK